MYKPVIFLHLFIFCLTFFTISVHAQNSLEVTVFHDLDGNGLEDGGEPTIIGVLTTELQLWQDINNNGAVDGGDIEFMHDNGVGGVYTFGTGNVLPDDNYILEYVEMGIPGGYYVTKLVNGVGLQDMDNDLDPLTNAANFSLLGDTPESLIDLGLVIDGNIGSYVWEDSDGDGIQDGGEPSINGVSVTLLDALTMTAVNNDIDFLPLTNPTITAGGGMYTFDNLPPGQYIVEFSVPAPSPDPWYPTMVTVNTDATDPTNDSDAENNPVAANYLQSHTIILLSDETDEEDKIDAGFFQSANIGSFVWEDSNLNGIQDGGETGIDGVTVTLLDEGTMTIVDNAAGFAPLVNPTITAGGGMYTFDNLPPGQYIVEFSVPAPSPDPWFPTISAIETDATDVTNDSDAEDNPTSGSYLQSHTIIILSGETDEEDKIDAGFFQAPSNDDCSFDNPDITTVTTGTTSGADGEVNYCGMPTTNDHQVWYKYTNTTGGNVDLNISISANNSNGNPATDISMLTLEDDCNTYTLFPGTFNNSYCNILDAGDQEIGCIEEGETILIILGSPEGNEGDFSITTNENTTQPIDNNDECTDALDIIFFNTCVWEVVFVDNNNACPEDFFFPGGCEFESDPTVWYSFTVPAASGNYSLEIQNIMDASSYLTIFDSSIDCDNPGGPALFADCETGAGPHVEYDPLIPGVTYLIAFGNPIPGPYSFEIKINFHPANDECVDAEALVANTSTDGTTICATEEIAGYNSGVCTDNDETNTVWFSYSVAAGEKGFDFSITGSGVNPITGDINVVVFNGLDCDSPTAIDEVCTTSTVINEEFECIGVGDYLMRVSTSDIGSGDFEILIEPLVLVQYNDNCEDPDMTAFSPPLENVWMVTMASTLEACPESFDVAANCGFDDYPVVWYEITSPVNATALDLMSTTSSAGVPFLGVFESTTECFDLNLVAGSTCYTGIFEDLESIGEEQIPAEPFTSYLIAIGSNDPFGSINIEFGIKWITPGAPCPNGENIGDPCDDDDDCTIEDTIDEDCNCVGVFQDSDMDGTCDADDVCPDGPEPGTECDDEDACTIDDAINDDCECEGVFQDSDGDGTCDADDVCEDGPEPGTACDDEDICTEDDVITEDCLCLGTFVDSDNDGVCDAEDICEDGPEPGTACDDEDECTIEDNINEDCICVGTFVDSDGDGTCDAEDVCPEGPEPGTACDDENDCTIDDVINEDCLCIGTFVDSDFDGTCDAEDICNGGPEPGTACDDEDACTIDDTINDDCDCVGVFQDSDEDGTCDAEDICEDGPEPGTACDDGDDATFNDQITPDCICVGTDDITYCPGIDLFIGDACDDGDECTINDVVNNECNCVGEFIDSDEDGVCDANDQCPDGPEPETPCDDNNDETINDQINNDCECEGEVDSTYCLDLELYIGDNCDDGDSCTINDIVTEDCNCLGTFQDTDGDGVCDAEDVCPDGPEPGTPCDDMDENTVNDEISEDCECIGVIVPGYCVELDLFVGDTCDDGNDCTISDIVTDDCECIGEFQDSDGDGICNAEDNCPGLSNEDQLDNDMDGIGDVCDADDDNDGILDIDDNCPFDANEDQSDEDMDGIGDVCDVVNIENQIVTQITLYPNPTKGILFIDSNIELHYRIFNTQGKMILRSDKKVDNINISHLPPGLYFVELFDVNDSYGFTKIFKLNS